MNVCTMQAMEPWLVALERITQWDIRPPPLPVCILPHLLLGDKESAHDLAALRQNAVTHVLCLATDSSPSKEQLEAAGIVYHHIAALDPAGDDLLPHVEAASEYVSGARDAGGRCLIHCHDGIDRSGLLATAMLMLHERLPIVEAVRRCKLARGVVLENESFRTQLCCFAQRHGLLGDEPAPESVRMPGPEDQTWQRRGKWEAFYSGLFRPHLESVPDRPPPIEALPWRSKSATPELLTWIHQGRLPTTARCVELGCGTGENLCALARASAFALGIDVVAAAVTATNAALSLAKLTNAHAVVADILSMRAVVGAYGMGIGTTARESTKLTKRCDGGGGGMPVEIAPSDGGGMAFDFALDVQTFHCVRKVDRVGAALAYESLLRPGGTLLMLTGNADEPVERGPERLTRAEVQAAFDGTELRLERLEAFRFEWTDAYRRQPFDEPPLGWLSVWTRRAPVPFVA